MAENLPDIVRGAGICGAGGAGFPTHIKVASRVDTVIANGAECEPLLHTDKSLMIYEAASIVEGLRLVLDSTGAKDGVIATKAHYRDAVRSIEAALGGDRRIRLHLLEDFYPSGDEQILTYEVTRRIVPEGAIPLASGVLVHNVGTLVNIWRATQGFPVTFREVTVTGEVNEPKVVRVPIGTPFSELIRMAGGTKLDRFALIEGGPMMGRVAAGPGDAVTKTGGGLIVLPEDHYLAGRKTARLGVMTRRAIAACCQCRECTDLCPRWLLGHNLNPHMVQRAVMYDRDDMKDEILQAFLCCLCGVCEFYACNQLLSPRMAFQAIKDDLGKARVKNPYNRLVQEPRPQRDGAKIPLQRLVAKLGLSKYHHKRLPFERDLKQVRAVAIPMKQHMGAPSKPVVKAGDRVREGDLVGAIPDGAMGVAVHASISGVVSLASEACVRIEA